MTYLCALWSVVSKNYANRVARTKLASIWMYHRSLSKKTGRKRPFTRQCVRYGFMERISCVEIIFFMQFRVEWWALLLCWIKNVGKPKVLNFNLGFGVVPARYPNQHMAFTFVIKLALKWCTAHWNRSSSSTVMDLWMSKSSKIHTWF